MQVGESTLKQLIEGEKQFQVPLYQRQYAWETPQLSQLWDDILEQYDILTPDDSGSSNASAPTHFGSMYQGSASLRIEGEFRVLTDTGRQLFEENRHRLDEVGT